MMSSPQRTQKPGCSINRTAASSVSQSPERNRSSVVTLGLGTKARDSRDLPESRSFMVHVLHEIQVSPDLCSLSHIAALCLYARLVHPRPLLFSSLSLLGCLPSKWTRSAVAKGLFMVLGKGPQTLQEVPGRVS